MYEQQEIDKVLSEKEKQEYMDSFNKALAGIVYVKTNPSEFIKHKFTSGDIEDLATFVSTERLVQHSKVLNAWTRAITYLSGALTLFAIAQIVLFCVQKWV